MKMSEIIKHFQSSSQIKIRSWTILFQHVLAWHHLCFVVFRSNLREDWPIAQDVCSSKMLSWSMSIKIGFSIGWLIHHSHDSFIHFSSDFFFFFVLWAARQRLMRSGRKIKCCLLLIYKCWSLWLFHNIKSKKQCELSWTTHVIKFKNKQNNLETDFESSCPIWKSSSYPRYPMISTARTIEVGC